MRTRSDTFILLLLASSLFAGCTSHSTTTTSETGSVSTTSSAASSLPQPPNPLPINTTQLPLIQVSQCTGFSGFSHAMPKQVAPGQPPPGWEPKNPLDDFSNIDIGGGECDRIHVGPYERGPIRYVWNGHTTADIPTKCVTNLAGTTHSNVLHVLTINDAELADYLHQQYGMPTVYVDIQVQSQAAGDLTQYTWTWGPPGQTPSTLNIFDDGTSDDYNIVDRFWWPRGEGLAQLDFSYTRLGEDLTDRPTYGTMEPPMLVPPEQGNFVGTMRYFSSMSGEAEVSFYSDRFCEHPEPAP